MIIDVVKYAKSKRKILNQSKNSYKLGKIRSHDLRAKRCKKV
jgi:hypothetical protein